MVLALAGDSTTRTFMREAGGPSLWGSGARTLGDGGKRCQRLGGGFENNYGLYYLICAANDQLPVEIIKAAIYVVTSFLSLPGFTNMPSAAGQGRATAPERNTATMTPGETARYTKELLDSLRSIALRQDHLVLAGLLDAAAREARRLVSNSF